MKPRAACAALVVAATIAACRSGEDRARPAASVASATAQPARPPSPPDAAPPGEANPALAGAKYEAGLTGTIADDCADAKAVLATSPKNALDWTLARQVFIANPQFGYVSQFSGKPGQVVLMEGDHAPTNSLALVASCKEGITCTRLAAAYKIVVPSSRPELYCGAAASVGELRPSTMLPYDKAFRALLPTDTRGKCARLAACRAALTGRLDGDPALECQKKPTAFPLKCASEFPCAALLACLGL